ncbi:hypothetical protein Tco_0253195, partial [Tanacetum coccineum]
YELPPSLICFLCQMLQRFRRHASHIELFDQEVKSFSWQGFGEDVSQLVFGPDKVYSIFHLLLYEMVVNIDVLCS